MYLILWGLDDPKNDAVIVCNEEGFNMVFDTKDDAEQYCIDSLNEPYLIVEV
jgi:hypothetical protein